MTEPETTKAPAVTETWVYAGRRQLAKGLGFAFAEEHKPEALHFFVKRPKALGYTPGIGSRYTVEVERPDDDTVLVGGWKYVGSWREDSEALEDLVKAWTAESVVAETQDEQERRGKAAAGPEGDVLLALCEPLRQMYKKQVGTARRQALLAAMIERVTR